MDSLYESQTADEGRLDRLDGLAIAGAMSASAMSLLGLALSRLSAFAPGGSFYMGMLIVTVGFVVNARLWPRYTLEPSHPAIRLYVRELSPDPDEEEGGEGKGAA
jgi:hypothetical protein